MKQDWEIKKLGEVCEIISDGDWIESRHQSESGIRLIQTGNIGNGIFKAKDDKPHYISEATFEELDCTEIFSGDCLVSRLPEPIGRACIIPELKYRMITAVDCSIIRFKDIVIPKLFIYNSQSISYQKAIDAKTTGTTRKRISRKNLESIQVPVPSLAEQERIVAELDCLSGVIEKKKQQLKELDALAQSIFYEMFGDPITNDKGWEVKKLGEVSKIITGTTPSTKDDSNWDGEINWVTPAELNIQLYYGETERKISEKAAKSLSIMPIGTVLLSTRAPIGKIAITTVPMCCNQGFKNMICNDDLNNIFLYYYLMLTMDEIKKLGRGATFKEVSKQDISNYQIPLPPLTLQQAFASKIEAIEKQKELIKQSIKEVETLFNSRMDYYFN